MSRVVLCPNGHSWNSPESVCAVAHEILRCPECGATIERQAWQTVVSREESGEFTDGRTQPLPSLFTADDPEFEFLEELGQGGMGVVYKARHRRLDRVVAIKMILDGEFASRDQLSRFLREATVLARLQHPNIVQIHQVGESTGRPFVCLEFVEHGSLARNLNGAPQRADVAARLVERLARAVHYMHEHGVLHRDLKPANVLLAPADNDRGIRLSVGPNESLDSEPKIADFGLAKRLDGQIGSTQTGDFLGTPSYMAPEQIAGNARLVGVAADVYALGAILYELLTGRPPFLATRVADTYRQVLSDEPVPPSQFHPKLPRDLETICFKCLAKEPHKRYDTAAALSEDLRRFLNGEFILARPTPPLEGVQKWIRRRPALAGLYAVAVGGVMTILTAPPRGG